MPKLIEEIPLVTFSLNHCSDIPLYQQLYNLLREAILDGKIKPGKRLPGTRSLAAELKISRNTVAIAFEQLIIEGYISGRTGSGSFVNEIPDKAPDHKLLNLNKEQIKKLQAKRAWKNLPSNILNRKAQDEEILPFQNGVPALNEFPVKTWMKIFNKSSINISNLHLGYGGASGFKPLREAIVDYLKTYRAVKCTPEQVIIVNGSQQGLDLIGRALLHKASKVWLEDPGYFGVRASMMNTDSSVYPCPIDDEGLDVSFSIKQNPKPNLIYTTPSHQFPLGITMSVSRRIQLLNYAKKNNCWIVEDDYDSEFRYVGNPLPSLQGMDQNNSVLYLGTFSKVLVPGLRLGYLVLPDSDMIDTFISLKFIIDRQSPILEQIVLARYLEEGHFTRHIRKMRMLYKSRRDFLIEELNKNFEGLLTVKPSSSGMQIIVWLPENLNDKKVADEALKYKLILNPLSNYSIKFHQKPGLILGYTAFNEQEIKTGLNKLKKLLNEFHRSL